MLYGHTAPGFFHIYTKTEPNAAFTTHVIDKYVPQTNYAQQMGNCIIDDEY